MWNNYEENKHIKSANSEATQPERRIEKEEKPKLVGLSLSFCIADVLDGYVQEEDIEMIIAGTCASTKEDWREVFDEYKMYYWQKTQKEEKKSLGGLLQAEK